MRCRMRRLTDKITKPHPLTRHRFANRFAASLATSPRYYIVIGVAHVRKIHATIIRGGGNKGKETDVDSARDEAL